jgi:hypothetical protein
MKTTHYFQKRLYQASLLLVPVLCLLNDVQVAFGQGARNTGAPAQGGGTPAQQPIEIGWIPGAIIGVVAAAIFFFIQQNKKKQ